jgi:hypothetical protein
MLLGRFQSSVLMHEVCTQYRLHFNFPENDEACMYKLVFENALYVHCTNLVHHLYIQCTYIVQTNFNCSENDEACMYKLVFENALYVHCTNLVHHLYKCTYIVQTKHGQCTYCVHVTDDVSTEL